MFTKRVEEKCKVHGNKQEHDSRSAFKKKHLQETFSRSVSYGPIEFRIVSKSVKEASKTKLVQHVCSRHLFKKHIQAGC